MGFAGLGIMGSRMARNLATKGFAVTVWNRTHARAEALTAHGAKVAPSVAALAEGSEVFCTCVADPAALESVYFGPTGALAHLKRGALCIDFSTVSPELNRRLFLACGEKGIDYVEAPVTGSKGGADKGTLVLMVGATEAAFARAEPIFRAVGEKWIRCGEVGAGSQVKLAGNALIALMLQGLSEGMLLAQRAGVDPKKLIEVVQASGFRSPYFEFKGNAILRREFETHFSIDLMFKDLSLFLDSAARWRIPTPVTAAVRETYQLARAQGKGEQDIGAVVTALEDLSGERLQERQG